MRSKIEVKLNQVLGRTYQVIYEPKILYGAQFKLKVDFELKYNDTIIYFEYSGMNFFKKYFKILDIAKHNKNFYVIFDDEHLETELNLLTSFPDNLSNLTLEKTIKRIDQFYLTCKSLIQ